MNQTKRKEYVGVNDESLLVSDGWKYGSSNLTLWKDDTNGVTWCADVSRPSGMWAIEFRTLDKDHRLSTGKFMVYDDYVKLFR